MTILTSVLCLICGRVLVSDAVEEVASGWTPCGSFFFGDVMGPPMAGEDFHNPENVYRRRLKSAAPRAAHGRQTQPAILRPACIFKSGVSKEQEP